MWNRILNEVVPDVVLNREQDPTNGALFFANIVRDLDEEERYADTLARLVQNRFLRTEELSREQALDRAGYGYYEARFSLFVYNRLASVSLEGVPGRVANHLRPLDVAPLRFNPRLPE